MDEFAGKSKDWYFENSNASEAEKTAAWFLTMSDTTHTIVKRYSVGFSEIAASTSATTATTVIRNMVKMKLARAVMDLRSGVSHAA